MGRLRDLLGPLTTEETKASIYAVLTVLGVRPAEWRPGDPEAAIVHSVAATVATLWTRWVTPVIGSGFLDWAIGPGLQATAKQVYNVDFIPAAFASGEWTGTNAGISTAGPFAPGDLVFAHSTSGKTYRNTSTVSFLPATPLTIPIEAVERGTASDAAPGAIVLQTVVLGLTGSNALSVLGQDDEEPSRLRNRCRLKLGALSPNGSASAYEYVALTPTDPNGRWDHGVTVTRAKVSSDSSTATVSVLLAGNAGALTGGEVTAVNLAIQTTVVPEAITCTVASATGVAIPVTYTLYVLTTAGYSAPEVEALVDDALVTLFRALTIGGTVLPGEPGRVYRNVIEAAILGAVPGSLEVTLVAPAANVEIASTEVPVLGTITPTVVLV